ncbi:MAG: hypothetical protein FWG83_00905 [Oscillospiraceae bacterium]|nr:hypothetical protein [Oscillospiraceae bacterium]
MNNYNYLNLMQTNLKALMNVIDKGIELLEKNAGDDYFSFWIDYAQNILGIIESQMNYRFTSDFFTSIPYGFRFSSVDRFSVAIRKLMEYYRTLSFDYQRHSHEVRNPPQQQAWH